MRFVGKRLVSAAMVALAGCLAVAQTVRVEQGLLSGSREAGNGVASFKGVPFAAPPVGDLRWHAPQPAAAWMGARKADAFGASCMQTVSGERLPWTKEFMVQNAVSEDCLYLNVWTPKADAAAKLPVVVYIHGGAFSEGSGAIDVYDGTNLAAKGLVVVTINYRLGVFGFFAHPELTAESEHHSSGNYGLLDQIAALRWVNKNIAAFGGDAKRVMIWGQSAGAFSVGALVASPAAKGLFERAQADSALSIAALPMATLTAAEKSGAEFAAQQHAAGLKELRAMSAEDLMKNAAGGMSLRFAPIVDGWVLPDTPNAMNAKGTDNDVAVTTGYQAGDSMMMLMFQPIKTLDAYHQMVAQRYGAMAAEFEKLYPVASAEEMSAALVESGQEKNRVSMYLWAAARRKSHKQPVYTYYFDRAIPWPQHPGFGAFHTGEIPYFFANLDKLDRPWEATDRELSIEAAGYLKNFAASGNPNGNGLAKWPEIDATRGETMELGAHAGGMPLADAAKVDFWTRYFNSEAGKSASPF